VLEQIGRRERIVAANFFRLGIISITARPNEEG
jgi:hypothetical protein